MERHRLAETGLTELDGEPHGRSFDDASRPSDPIPDPARRPRPAGVHPLGRRRPDSRVPAPLSVRRRAAAFRQAAPQQAPGSAGGLPQGTPPRAREAPPRTRRPRIGARGRRSPRRAGGRRPLALPAPLSKVPAPGLSRLPRPGADALDRLRRALDPLGDRPAVRGPRRRFPLHAVRHGPLAGRGRTTGGGQGCPAAGLCRDERARTPRQAR